MCAKHIAKGIPASVLLTSINLRYNATDSKGGGGGGGGTTQGLRVFLTLKWTLGGG